MEIRKGRKRRQSDDKATTKQRQSNDKATMEFIVIHIAGAVYSLSDMIIFELLQNAEGELKMRVIVQIEVVHEKTFVFNWSEIPSEVLEIYNYVNSKSSLKGDVLIGTHIGRKQGHQYALIKFGKNPIGEYNTHPLVTSPDADVNMFKRMHKIIKNH